MFSKKIVMLLVLLLIVAALSAACGPGGGGSSAGQSVTITASEFQFAPAVINAKSGEKVTVTLSNKGSVQHTFELLDVNFKLLADASKSANGTFTAPATAGTYQFECNIPGHKEAGMVGQLIVK